MEKNYQVQSRLVVTEGYPKKIVKCECHMNVCNSLQLCRYAISDFEVGPPWSETHSTSHMSFWTLLSRTETSLTRLNIDYSSKIFYINLIKTLERLNTSGINITQGFVVSELNSVLLASCKPRTDRANSMTAICSPKQMPRYGTLFSQAYFAARIFPCTPLSPNPPGTRTPTAPCNERLFRRSRGKITPY